MPEPLKKDAASIETLQERYAALNRRKIQAETQRDEAKKRLDALKAQAKSAYQTDDLAELQKRLDDMIAENTRKREKYKSDLDTIERKLAEVEQKFSDTAGQSGR